MANTNIKFSSVESAVTEIKTVRENMDSALESFENAVKTLINEGDYVGMAADTFDDSMQRLKRDKFEAFSDLINQFADTISAAGKRTEETAKAAEMDAAQNLY